MSQTVDIPQSLKVFLFISVGLASEVPVCEAKAGLRPCSTLKVNKKTLQMEEEDNYDNIPLEDLAEELPENAPRYVVLSYELSHPDGRTSYPLVLINWAPATAETGSLTLHASALIPFQNASDVTRVIEVRENVEESLTTEALDKQLLPKH
ncbi:uncharacterized protein EI90DRAFT_2987271 [Cantharellus anzutake]|uniref:uncharacterized protein n=1 Tax=Cantharellus anzutake TaxID=1750568 RepID=UPI001904525B|nr:uncharacterized protein EI90DRAFT_2987271 [Cantharellus anzutake]KAF8343972.1 hypothetical protein EI90DRAFT_2987271 [Cantharellus anzutake]